MDNKPDAILDTPLAQFVNRNSSGWLFKEKLLYLCCLKFIIQNEPYFNTPGVL